MRLEDGACRLYLELERVVRRLAHDGSRVAVQENGGLVARRVLELLHHQVPAPGRRRPVHTPKRLSLLVVAHRMEVEARRPAQQQPAPFERTRSGVGEERVEVDEAWVDEDGLAGRKRDLDPLEAERVLERRPSRSRSDSGRAEPRRECTRRAVAHAG